MASVFALYGRAQAETEAEAPRSRPVEADEDKGVRAAVLEAVSGWVPGELVPHAAPAAGPHAADSPVRGDNGGAGRRRAGPGMSTGDLAYEAARLLVGSGQQGPVGAVVLATATPDRPGPATAPALTARLGLGTVPALDIGAVSSGFVYGLALCHGLVVSGLYDRVLLVAADAYAIPPAPADRAPGAFFGCGAGAALIGAGRSGAPGELLGFDLGSDGTGSGPSASPADGARSRPAAEQPAAGEEFLQLDGRSLRQHAVERMTGSCLSLLRTVGWDVAQVDHFVPQQAGERILRSVAERVGIGPRRRVPPLDRLGGTGAAAIPLALADAHRQGRFRPGDRMLLTAFGGGLTWGSAALRWPDVPRIPADTGPDTRTRPPRGTGRNGT